MWPKPQSRTTTTHLKSKHLTSSMLGANCSNRTLIWWIVSAKFDWFAVSRNQPCSRRARVNASQRFNARIPRRDSLLWEKFSVSHQRNKSSPKNQSIFHDTLNWSWSKSCRGYEILGECNKIKNGIYTRVDSVGFKCAENFRKGNHVRRDTNRQPMERSVVCRWPKPIAMRNKQMLNGAETDKVPQHVPKEPPRGHEKHTRKTAQFNRINERFMCAACSRIRISQFPIFVARCPSPIQMHRQCHSVIVSPQLLSFLCVLSYFPGSTDSRRLAKSSSPLNNVSSESNVASLLLLLFVVGLCRQSRSSRCASRLLHFLYVNSHFGA